MSPLLAHLRSWWARYRLKELTTDDEPTIPDQPIDERPADAPEVLELFPADGLRVVPEPAGGEEARRTQRALAALAAGHHPVSRIRLHDDAPPLDDRRAPGPRCGTCVHLRRKPGARHVYLKCEDHITSGPATDLRAWWPACAAWIPNYPEASA